MSPTAASFAWLSISIARTSNQAALCTVNPHASMSANACLRARASRGIDRCIDGCHACTPSTSTSAGSCTGHACHGQSSGCVAIAELETADVIPATS